MATTPLLTDLRNPALGPITLGNRDGQPAVRPHPWQRAGNTGRYRFDPVTLGFWLGGVALGTGGCILGASLPYHHPVGVTISVLWWGIYIGCFGAGIGALVGRWTNRTLRGRCHGSDDAGKPPTGRKGES